MKWLILTLSFSWAVSAAPVTSPLPSPAPNNSPVPPTPIVTVSPTSIPISSPIPNSPTPSPSPSASPSPSTSPSPTPSGTPDPNRGPRITGGKSVCWQKDRNIQDHDTHEITFDITADIALRTIVLWELIAFDRKHGRLSSSVEDNRSAMANDFRVDCNGWPLRQDNSFEVDPGKTAKLKCIFLGDASKYDQIILRLSTIPWTNSAPASTQFTANVKTMCCTSKTPICGPDEVMGPNQCGCPSCLCRNGLPKVDGRCPCEGNWGREEVRVTTLAQRGETAKAIQDVPALFVKDDHSLHAKLQFCIGATMPVTAPPSELLFLENEVRRNQRNWEEAWNKIYKAPPGGKDIRITSEIDISYPGWTNQNPKRFTDCKRKAGYHYIRVTGDSLMMTELETGKSVADCRSYSTHWKFCKSWGNGESMTGHEFGHVLGFPDHYGEGFFKAFQECGQASSNSIMGDQWACWPNCKLPVTAKRLPFDLACGGPCPALTSVSQISCEKCGDTAQKACRDTGDIQFNLTGRSCECIPYGE